jgi:hypothetical protein
MSEVVLAIGQDFKLLDVAFEDADGAAASLVVTDGTGDKVAVAIFFEQPPYCMYVCQGWLIN